MPSELSGLMESGGESFPGSHHGGWRVSAKRFAEIGAAARRVRLDQAAHARADVLSASAKLQSSGAKSLRQIAASLNVAEIPTLRGQGQWSAVQVQRTLKVARARKLPLGLAAITEVVVA